MTDLYLRRREMMNFEEYSIGTLRYWWSGADAPYLGSDNKYHWLTRKPRLAPNVPHTTWNSNEKCYELNDSQYATFGMNTIDFTLGNHWRIVFNMDFKRQNKTSGQYFLDLGAVTSATRNIGLAIVFDDNGDSFYINWKMNGTTPLSGVRTYMEKDSIPLDNQYHNLYGYYEIVDGGDGYDRFRVCINGQMYYSDTQIPKVFYGSPWDTPNAFIGRGAVSGYGSDIKLYDLKIYQID